MDLAELKFVVITDDLVTAAERVKALGAEVSKLNKPMQDLASNSNKVSSATEKAAKATETKAKADTKIVDTSSKLESLLDKLTNRYTDMAKGSTSAEAGVLQLARSLGATTEDALKPYKAILENIRELSKSPFDSAIGSVRSITQEYDSLTYRAELASKGIFLTTAQLKEYSRIANEIKGKLKAADLDPTKGEGLDKFNSELKVQQDLYLGIATKVNTLKTAEKDRNDLLNAQMKESVRLQEASDNLFKYNLIRHKQDQDGYKQDMLEMRKYYSALEKESKPTAQTTPARMDAAVDAYRQNQAKVTNDAAKANAYLAKEMERVNRLNAESESVTSSTNNRLIRFEQELRKSGATAEEQSHKLAAYRKELMSTQKVAGDRQVDYLSRALGPQITDIAVGLATGQSPMMVLLQQGGQLRDQFALAGVAGKDMGDMLTKATLGMVSSVKDVALAIGGALGGAVVAAGTNFTDFAGKVTGVNSLFDSFKRKIAATGEESFGFIGTLGRISTAVSLLAGLLLASAVVALIAYGVALKEVIAQESALSKAINLTGASLGLTTNSAMALSKELAGSKGNVGSYVTAITEIAKAGGVTSDNLKTVATTIVEVSKVTGIGADTLAKNFSKISEKPLEGLIPFAKELGTINVSVLKHIQQLERAGKHAEAAKVATEAYSKALKDVASVIKEDMGAIETIFVGIGSAAKSMWDAILNVGRKGTLEDQMKEAVSSLLEAQKGKSWYSRFGRTNEEEVQYYQDIVQSLGKQINAQKELGAVKAKNAADVTKFEKDFKGENKEADRLKKSFEDSLETAKKFYQTQVGGVNELTKSEIALNKVKEDNDYKKYSPAQKKQIDDIYQQAKANELLVIAEKDRATQMDAIAALMGKSDGFGKDYYTTLKQLDNAYVDGNISLEKYVDLLNKLYQTTPQAKAFANAQIDHVKTMADIASSRVGVSMQYEGDFKTADEKAAIKNLSDYRKSVADADSTYDKQVAEAAKIMTATNLEEAKVLYKAQADARKGLAQDTYNSEQRLLTDSYKQQKAYANAFEDLFKGMGDAIVDFALTGKASFGDMVNSILVGLIKMQVQMQMSGMLQAMGGGKGIITSVASMFTGTPVPSAKGNMFDSGGIQAFANGGAFTNSIVSEPTLFKFAKGTGLMGEAGPEAIMPLRRGSDGSLGVVAAGSSGSNVSVQVINNSNAQATTNETVDSKGNRKIEVVIGDMQAGEISRSGSASQKSIKSTFGLQPQLIRR